MNAAIDGLLGEIDTDDEQQFTEAVEASGGVEGWMTTKGEFLTRDQVDQYAPAVDSHDPEQDREQMSESLVDKVSSILHHVLEDEGEDEGPELDVKELSQAPGAGAANVRKVRRTRMKLVDLPYYTFLISYLTPVAYFDKNTDTFYRTNKHWSKATERHISLWQRIIGTSAAWQADPRNHVASDYPGGQGYVPYPKFEWKAQDEISGLFRELLKTMEISQRGKERLYHVPPVMRRGSQAAGASSNWPSAHGKMHDAGNQALPRQPGKEEDLRPFFQDFEPQDPEYWEWTNPGARRSNDPHES